MIEFITGFTKEMFHQASIAYVVFSIDSLSPKIVREVLDIEESPSHFNKWPIPPLH